MAHYEKNRLIEWSVVLSLTLALGACAATGTALESDDDLFGDAGFIPDETDPSDDEFDEEDFGDEDAGDDEEGDPIPPPDDDETDEDDEPPFILGPGTDVVFIGDSWMNLTGIAELGILPPGFDLLVYALLPPMGIQQSVVHASGNRPYRSYGVPGTMFLDGAIPAQYRRAREDDAAIRTVVMTGGGNDILLDFPDFASINFIEFWTVPEQLLHRINHSATANCALWSGIGLANLAFLPVDPILRDLVQGGIAALLASPLAAGIDRHGWRCRERIDELEVRYVELLDEMAADGVEDVVIVIYTRHTWIGHAPIDYVWERISPVCEEAALRCHMIDADIVNHGGPIALLEGIHPDGPGYDAIGRYVFEQMVNEQMAR